MSHLCMDVRTDGMSFVFFIFSYLFSACSAPVQQFINFFTLNMWYFGIFSHNSQCQTAVVHMMNYMINSHWTWVYICWKVKKKRMLTFPSLSICAWFLLFGIQNTDVRLGISWSIIMFECLMGTATARTA